MTSKTASVSNLLAANPTAKRPVKKHEFDNSVRPWENWPYPLVSWWDMEQFSIAPLYAVATLLSQLKTSCAEYAQEQEKQKGVAFLPAPLKQVLRKNLREIRLELERLDLKMAVACIDDALLDLKMNFITLEQLDRIYGELDNSIRRDMQTTLFFHVDFKRREFYDQQMLFGPKVAHAFPRAFDDIREAGTCYAFGRFTSCVFHLMRVMEIGVQTFGHMLGVDFPEDKEWGKILNIATGKINEQTDLRPRRSRDPEIVTWNQILAHLNSVKIGWRNPTMHPNESYDAGEAEELLALVQTFMKSLAKHVNPPTAGPTLVR